MASHVDVQNENCKGCGLCIPVCPTKQLSFSGKFNANGYNYIQVANDNCIGCGFCYYSCPEPHALRVYREDKKAAS